MNPYTFIYQLDQCEFDFDDSATAKNIFAALKTDLEPMAREKGLEFGYAPCSLSVRSDRRLLRRLLQNLVSNAIKYTPKGRVLIGCRRRGKDLRIEIYDTGLGIPASKRKVVFQEFQRLDEGAKVARGLGLGLSIVERIGRVLDHKVDLKSTPGSGSRFSVFVPISSVAPAQDAPREVVRADRGQLLGIAVLCIDNEPQILDGMQTLLGGWGCRVIQAADLASAMAAVTEAKLTPDGLLVDYHLDNRGNGIDAIAELLVVADLEAEREQGGVIGKPELLAQRQDAALGLLVERVDDEQWAFVADIQHFAVDLARQYHVVFFQVGKRDLGSVIVQGDHVELFALERAGVFVDVKHTLFRFEGLVPSLKSLHQVFVRELALHGLKHKYKAH